MTTEHKWKCDLCNTSLFSLENRREALSGQPGIGIKWHGHRMEKTLLMQSEHHVCIPCLGALKEMIETDMVGFDLEKAR